jgi:antitoxin VapB
LAFYIRSEQVDRLARELAAATGESITEAVGKALAERLQRVRPHEPSPSERERWQAIRRLCMDAREIARQTGFTPPTKEELEEMLGFERLARSSSPASPISSHIAG